MHNSFASYSANRNLIRGVSHERQAEAKVKPVGVFGEAGYRSRTSFGYLLASTLLAVNDAGLPFLVPTRSLPVPPPIAEGYSNSPDNGD